MRPSSSRSTARENPTRNVHSVDVFPCVSPYFLRIRVFAPTSLPKASWSPICANLGRRKWSRAPQERPRDPQEEPKSAPERPKSDPRAAKSGPRVAQERPKSSQERPKSDQERPKSGQERPKGEPELRRWAQERPRRAQDGPGPPKGRPKTPQTPPRTPPNAPQEAPRSLQECEVRPKSFEIVERCRKKSRKQTLEPQVRNPRTKQAARRSTRRKIRRPRVRSSPYDPHEESSASQRKPQEFPNNPKRQPCCTHDELLPGTPRTRNIPARGRRCSPAGRSRSAAPSAARRVVNHF